MNPLDQNTTPASSFANVPPPGNGHMTDAIVPVKRGRDSTQEDTEPTHAAKRRRMEIKYELSDLSSDAVECIVRCMDAHTFLMAHCLNVQWHDVTERIDQSITPHGVVKTAARLVVFLEHFFIDNATNEYLVFSSTEHDFENRALPAAFNQEEFQTFSRSTHSLKVLQEEEDIQEEDREENIIDKIREDSFQLFLCLDLLQTQNDAEQLHLGLFEGIEQTLLRRSMENLFFHNSMSKYLNSTKETEREAEKAIIHRQIFSMDPSKFSMDPSNYDFIFGPIEFDINDEVENTIASEQFHKTLEKVKHIIAVLPKQFLSKSNILEIIFYQTTDHSFAKACEFIQWVETIDLTATIKDPFLIIGSAYCFQQGDRESSKRLLNQVAFTYSFVKTACTSLARSNLPNEQLAEYLMDFLQHLATQEQRIREQTLEYDDMINIQEMQNSTNLLRSYADIICDVLGQYQRSGITHEFKLRFIMKFPQFFDLH